MPQKRKPTKPTKPQQKKTPAPRVTDPDRLRTLLSLSAGAHKLYTQKEMAAALGVSTRTLRRIKNIPGYEPSPRTMERIRPELRREEKRVRRAVQRKYKLPRTPVINVPREFFPRVAKDEQPRSRTLVLDVEGWRGSDIIRFLTDAARDPRFYSWTAKIEVPPGVAISGKMTDDGGGGGDDINEDDEKIHYMIGPYSLTGKSAVREIQRIISFHLDAGRRIVEISIVENFERE